MNRNYYIDGNTVRELEVQPVRREREQSQREMEEIRRRKSRRNAARRNREKALSMGRGQVVFLTMCVFACAAMAALYIGLQAQITTSMSEIAALESSISSLTADNDEVYKNLSTSLDLDYIKEVAINELGMHYADEDQIVYYSVDKSSFMDQYLDIPE